MPSSPVKFQRSSTGQQSSVGQQPRAQKPRERRPIQSRSIQSRSRQRQLLGIAAGGLWMLVGLTGCRSAVSPAPEAIYTIVTPGTLSPGQPIPIPQGEIILTVAGKVGRTNVGETIQMDREMIEALGTVSYRVEDPFERVERTFEGVLMTDLLELWQVPDDAQNLLFTALDDYQVQIPIDKFRDYPVLFALKTDGEYMQPDYRGPAMLVLPYEHYEFDRIYTDEFWIWQIESIQVQ